MCADAGQLSGARVRESADSMRFSTSDSIMNLAFGVVDNSISQALRSSAQRRSVDTEGLLASRSGDLAEGVAAAWKAAQEASVNASLLHSLPSLDMAAGAECQHSRQAPGRDDCEQEAALDSDADAAGSADAQMDCMDGGAVAVDARVAGAEAAPVCASSDDPMTVGISEGGLRATLWSS
jgi:hypothetical protein